MSEDNTKLYRHFLSQALSEEKQAIKAKNWTELAKIKVKINDLESKIEENKK